MRTNGLRAKVARKHKAATNSKHPLPVAPDLLGQGFSADKPDRKWVSGITGIWTDGGWLHLAVVLGLHSRRVIGWAIAGRMAAALVCGTLVMALYPQGTSGAGSCQQGQLSILAVAANTVQPPTRNCSVSTGWLAA